MESTRAAPRKQELMSVNDVGLARPRREPSSSSLSAARLAALQRGGRAARALRLLGLLQCCLALGGLAFWLLCSVGLWLHPLVVPGSLLLLAALWCLPGAADTLYALYRRGQGGQLVFTSKRGAVLALACVLVGLGAALTGLVGTLMSRAWAESAAALVLALACFAVLLHVCIVFMERLAEKPVSAQSARFFGQAREPQPRFHVRPRKALLLLSYLALVLAVLFFLLFNGATAYRLLARGIVERYQRPPAAEMIGAASGTFRLSCMGHGPANEQDVLVLLDADIASSSYGYAWLTTSLSMLWRTCSFDRAGYGWSDARMGPRTALNEARDLLDALRLAGLQRMRFVYVSHGLSAWNALLFRALIQPHQMVAMVFLDPLDPRYDRESLNTTEGDRRTRFEQWTPLALQLNSFGVMEPLLRIIPYFSPVWQLPASARTAYVHDVVRQSFWSTLMDENDVMDVSARQALSQFPYGTNALGTLPIVLWSRNGTNSLAYYSTLSNRTWTFFMEQHFFIFDKSYASDIVTSLMVAVLDGLRSPV